MRWSPDESSVTLFRLASRRKCPPDLGSMGCLRVRCHGLEATTQGKSARMGLRFTNLASGSGGNASLVETDGFGVLLDIGLGPRHLAARFASVGLSWSSVHAALLTHTHTDHWNDRTLAHMQRRRVPLYCHADHHNILDLYSPSFAGLRNA